MKPRQKTTASADRRRPSRPNPRPNPRSTDAGRAQPTRRTAGDSPKPARRREAVLLRCAPGLARWLIKELQFRKIVPRDLRPPVLRQRNHDLLLLARAERTPALAQLRLAEEVHRCPVYGRYKISLSQLDRMAEALAAAGRRRLVVTADGAHFNRQDLGRWLTRELAARGQRVDRPDAPPVFLFCIDAAFYFCLPLATSERAAGRDRRVQERPGSLPPTVAAAMAFVGSVGDDDTVLDPVCGSGTLLAEARGLAPGARCLGFDSDAAAIATARANLRGLPEIRLETGDSRALPVEAGTVSLVLANLPFGKQYGDPQGNAALYRAILAEIARVGTKAVGGLAGAWRAVLLTGDGGAFDAAIADRRDLAVAPAFKVVIRGEPATAYLVQPAARRGR